MQRTRNFAWITLASVLALPVEAQVITTVAGNSTWGQPIDVALDSAGNQYVSDVLKHVIYKVDRLGSATIVAGKGTSDYSGDGGLATNAALNRPNGVAIDVAGNLYIADYSNSRIRKVGANGIITTIAGTSTRGFSGDGGPAASAQIFNPIGLVLGAGGNLYFSDFNNHRIRKISANGIITTVAGRGTLGFSGDNGPAILAEINPGWLAVGPDGSLFFGEGSYDSGSRRVRKVAPNGTITTVAGNGTNGFSGDGGPAIAAALQSAVGVAVDSAGNLFIADYSGQRIRRVSSDGIITTYAGTGRAGFSGDYGPATDAQLSGPNGMAVDSQGNLYVAELLNQRVRKITVQQTPAMTGVSGAFLGGSGFSSNMYMEISGTNLSQTTRAWGGSDFNGSNAPTALDGVSVTVNGLPAFIRYVSPTQIGIIAPDDTATGPAPIQVQTPLGTSNVSTVNRQRISPTLQTTVQSAFGGRQYVLARTPDFRFFAGSPNLIEGLPLPAVRPGDTVVIYALGCGPTNPTTPAGTIAAQDSPMTLPFELRIGGIPAIVSSAGVVANTIGLYQFVVTIPSAPSGDQPIELIIDGVSNNQALIIAIGQ